MCGEVGSPARGPGDDGVVAVTCTANAGFPSGEEPTLSRFYTSHWNDGHFGGKFVWSHRYQNMLIMVGFILFFRFATFYALERINYSTR